MLREVAHANAEFLRARKGDTTNKEREKALQRLEEAYFMYKEVVNNLEVGRKFYNDLSKIVGRFKEEARTFSYTRRAEAAQLERYALKNRWRSP